MSLLLAVTVGGAWTSLAVVIYGRGQSFFSWQSKDSSDIDKSGFQHTSQPYFWKVAMNSVTDFFYAKDLHGRYIGQNKALLELYQHTSENCVLGKTNVELYPYMDKAVLLQLEEIDIRAAYSPFPIIVEEYVPSRTGEMLVCESVKCSYRGPDDTILGMICVSRDITSRKQVEMALLKSQAESQAASHAKSAFLANTSHEIRTPLNGVMGMLHLVQQTELTEVQRDYVHKAHEAAEHLLGVVNDILDFSKIEAGKMTLEFAPFSLVDAFSQVIDPVRLSAQQNNIDVIFTLDPLIPQIVLGDAMRLKQVLSNLLGNAVKFTHKGSIRVTCMLLERTPEAVHVSVTVSDTGIGISEQQIGRLFKAFSQGDISRTRQYGGTGLGLAISKELVSLMGGCIKVESRQGEGSTFIFSLFFGLPTLSEDDADVMPSLPTQPLERLRGQRVLLVEDNLINRLIAHELLEMCSIIVDEAQNGEEAVEKIRQNPYDIVLMDIQMPLMDGLTATRIVRKEHRFDSLPIIAMTAHAMKSDYEESLAAGMQEHVTKPIDPDVLYKTLLRWIKPVN